MISYGEMIAYGSDTDIMIEAANTIDALAGRIRDLESVLFYLKGGGALVGPTAEDT
jgi:hypothetical protein